MKAARWVLLGCPIIISLLPAPATADLTATARQALAGNAVAVKTLRAAGPAGMEALLNLAPSEALAASPAFNAALDTVCAQKDCAASHLYWYTDLEAARAAAKLSGRPILSLRLLGRLDEELSCANSRFFRTVLYANASVSQALRERFVLHWQSERPVPKVTVDFGDGRRLVGTVTGNSIHYILDSQGRLVDALPGLYGPGAFLRRLEDAAQAAGALGDLTDAEFGAGLIVYHNERLKTQAAALVEDFSHVSDKPVEMARAAVATVWQSRGTGPAAAAEASRRAASKSYIEWPLLTAVLPNGGQPPRFEGDFESIAFFHRQESELDASSRRLLFAKGGAWVGDKKQDALDHFQKLISEDTVKNEYVLHGVIHSWLAGGKGVPDLADFDQRVYSYLFLTPGSDPWLGLGPTELFSVLTPAG
jgi:hypothetical protein